LITKIPKLKKNIAIWFVPRTSSLKPITQQEIQWKNKLPKNRSEEFHHSRGYVREALSLIFDIPELKIPLLAPPSQPPLLPPGMGIVSFSHCIDGLFIGWSSNNIGVDIERFDRHLNPARIINNYFSYKERKIITSLEKEELVPGFLSYWVRKEAALKFFRGNIFKDLSNLEYLNKSNKILHKSNGFKVNSYLMKYEKWFISIASNDNFEDQFPIICLL
tara:strand:+ start:508 stop:1164 length:657 start_codon:yes stop_codon:yes gene_type:complete